ncbi:GNAT family N-acetyltransferase [Nocardia huaxiensis]|uniref:GNAT family N-acetyltransferase n=1 Tax=Nocardia huaxiensis TaxID=2755382 RepID=A0A7D6VP88_9NOCA|nr:GNAT family N-acetyltransferase [Nocardia huaxiensis]QLY34190.1 GNAT family N-acetyltransferase [Nocardia huaxiensis]UFT00151.1 GNAT family N-acetyltransferase [Nocardia huaxiensis]
MFCDLALGARVESVEVELIATSSTAARARTSSGFTIPLAGGVASFTEPDSPLNKVAGLGFAGIPTEAELDEIERRYAACDAPVQIELAHIADPALGELLTARGYRLINFENVLGLPLKTAPERITPTGVDIRPSGDDEFDLWIDTVAEGFATPDTQGIASHEEFPRDVIARAVRDLTSAAGVTRYLAIRNGEVAGAASMRISQGVAQLTGAATLPEHRRHGIQTALLSARLTEAAAAGCDIAVVTTQPASKSQQNVQRRGFDFLYTRAILVKD